MVIGAGFIGAEVASTCAGLGCRVTVLEALDIPLRNVIGPLLGAYCGSLHGANGVELRSGIAVQGVRRGPADAADVALGVAASGLVVDLAGGEALPADVVVVGIGVVPATGWLADSGLALQNGVVCDDRLFAADGIVATGDITRWNWRHDGGEELIRIEHWQVAAEQEAGVAAARGLMAGREEAAPFDPGPVLLVGPVRHPPPGAREPGWRRRGARHRGLARRGQVRGALRPCRSFAHAVMAIGEPRQLMGFRALLQAGASWDDALAHGAS